MSADTHESLDWWRENPLQFRDTDIPYESAIRSLGTADAPVELRRQNPSRWTLYMRNADEVAVFSYAAIFSMADDYYSGNLIPTGQPLPEDLPSERIERFATWKCQYAYAFDTAMDKSFFSLQQMLEEHAMTTSGFNPSGLPRREYQSGHDPAHTWRYWMRAPMFLRVNAGEARTAPPPHLHQWVIVAEKRSRIYRANPARPRVFSFDGVGITNIENSDPDTLQRGDIVLVHFVVSIVVTSSAWYSELTPVELVQVVPVMRLLSEALETGPPTIDATLRPALTEGERIGEPAPRPRRQVPARARAGAVPSSTASVRGWDRGNAPPPQVAVAVARTSRASSSSSAVSGLASSVAAMDVDDTPHDNMETESQEERPLGEPFEDLAGVYDDKAKTSVRSASGSLSSLSSLTSRSDRSASDHGKENDQSSRSSAASDSRLSGNVRSPTAVKRKRNPVKNSSTASTFGSDEEGSEPSSRQARRSVGKGVKQ